MEWRIFPQEECWQPASPSGMLLPRLLLLRLQLLSAVSACSHSSQGSPHCSSVMCALPFFSGPGSWLFWFASGA